jgi:hypothetical protein
MDLPSLHSGDPSQRWHTEGCLQVQIHGERQDKARGSPDLSRAYNLIVRVTNPTPSAE